MATGEHARAVCQPKQQPNIDREGEVKYAEWWKGKEIVQSPSYPRPYSLEVATCMDGTTYSDVPTLSKPDLFGIQVNYFNASKNDFPVGSLVFCQGTLTVLESVTSDPANSHATPAAAQSPKVIKI
ncbi:hypothetical protein V8E54_009706 [Elaphomyces granulatus]